MLTLPSVVMERCAVLLVVAVLAALLLTAWPVQDPDPEGGGAGGDDSVVGLNTTTARVLSRERRYVVFPRGASVQLVIEFTVGLYVPFTTLFTSTVSAGLAWRLPTQPQQVYLQRRAAGEDPDHEHRVRLLGDLVVLLDKLGLSGEHCVKRTLCELHRTRGRKGSFMEEILKALLTVPESPALRIQEQGPSDPNGSNLQSNKQCRARYANCPSVFDVPIDPTTA